MRGSRLATAFFIFLSALVKNVYNLDYSDLEALGLSCPDRDKCEGYRNNADYLERSCECDNACRTYKDCCIDVRRRGRSRSGSRSTLPNGMVCMPYGKMLNAGVYAITRCRNDWTGSAEVREKCEGPEDLRDPLIATPVTNVAQAVTYRNRYCAECNDAPLSNLTLFNFRIACEGSHNVTLQQLYADIFYNESLNSWGVNRLNSAGNATQFYTCDIVFDVPGYINNSVRFCRSNLISSCPATWTRPTVKRACEEYMAVVFDNEYAYRNPHCAICNEKTVAELSCSAGVSGRKRPMSFALLLDVNRSDGDQVGMRRTTTPECAANQKYDPFFKKCRQLVCALPGYTVVDGKCVSS